MLELTNASSQHTEFSQREYASEYMLSVSESH